MKHNDLSPEDRARIDLHDTTMDVALAEGKTLWEAQAAALRAVADQAAQHAAAAAQITQWESIPDSWQEATA